MVRHRSGSIECSTIVTRCFSKNGRISGGRSAITRSRMYLCASKPHASAGGPGVRIARTANTATRRVRIVIEPIALPLYLHQPAQCSQVAHVPRIGVAPAAALGRLELRRLEQHRQRGETAVVENPAERFQAETALADVLVAIDAAAARLLGVVEVKGGEAIEPHEPIEFLKGRSIPGL